MANKAKILGFTLLLCSGLAGCRALEPPAIPESTCIEACGARTFGRCDENQCRRGCRLALDRLVEHEGDSVIACVATSKTECNDELWAECAVKIGVHADGGPPAPTKLEDEE